MTGRQEIWQTIRAALEVLWTADTIAREGAAQRERGNEGPSEGDPAVALATAQSILDAADITLPTGDLAQGAYDAFGNYYSFPEHVVSDPLNISARPSQTEDGLHDVKADLTTGEETAEEHEDIVEEAERRREEKGKAVVDVRQLITVRARLSDGSKDVNISIGKGDSVRILAGRVAEEAQVSLYLWIWLGCDRQWLTRYPRSSLTPRRSVSHTWVRCSKKAHRCWSKAGSKDMS